MATCQRWAILKSGVRNFWVSHMDAGPSSAAFSWMGSGTAAETWTDIHMWGCRPWALDLAIEALYWALMCVLYPFLISRLISSCIFPELSLSQLQFPLLENVNKNHFLWWDKDYITINKTITLVLVTSVTSLNQDNCQDNSIRQATYMFLMSHGHSY